MAISSLAAQSTAGEKVTYVSTSAVRGAVGADQLLYTVPSDCKYAEVVAASIVNVTYSTTNYSLYQGLYVGSTGENKRISGGVSTYATGPETSRYFSVQEHRLAPSDGLYGKRVQNINSGDNACSYNVHLKVVY